MTDPITTHADLVAELERIHRIMSAANEEPWTGRKMTVWKADVLAIARAIQELKA